jgi:hypothetical protein
LRGLVAGKRRLRTSRLFVTDVIRASQTHEIAEQAAGEIKKQRYVYYHCTGYGQRCPGRHTREERLIEGIIGHLGDLLLERSSWRDDQWETTFGQPFAELRLSNSATGRKDGGRSERESRIWKTASPGGARTRPPPLTAG